MKRSHEYSLVILLCSIAFLSHLFYTVRSQQYPVWDEHHYLDLAIQQYDIVKTGGLHSLLEIVFIPTHRQPLYSVLIMIVLLFVGTSHTYTVALIINGLLFIASIVATYLLAKIIVSKATAFLAAFLFATFGNVLFYTHFTYTETATTTFAIWSLYALAKTHGFQQKHWSALAGILTGLAMLTRWIGPVFVLGGFFVEVLKAASLGVHTSNPKRRYTAEAIAVYLLPAVCIPLFFYFLYNHSYFFTYVNNNQSLGADWVRQYRDPAMANTFSIRSIMYYFNIIQQNTVWMLLLFVSGFITIILVTTRFILKQLLRKQLSERIAMFPKGYFFLTASFTVPYAFLTFVTIWKEDRFIVPLYPVIAIISVLAIEQLLQKSKTRIIAKIMIVVTVVIGFLNAAGAVWKIGPMGAQGLVDYITPRFVPHPRRLYLTPLVWPPTVDQTAAEIFLQRLAAEPHATVLPTLYIDVPYEPFVNAVFSRLKYELRIATITTEKTSATYRITTSPPADQGNILLVHTIPAISQETYLIRQKN